jgi:hypothetical protein
LEMRDGDRLDTGLGQVGDRLETGWRQIGNSLGKGLRPDGTGWRPNFEERVKTGYRIETG